MIKINNFEYINLSQKNKIKKSIYKQIIINSNKIKKYYTYLDKYKLIKYLMIFLIIIIIDYIYHLLSRFFRNIIISAYITNSCTNIHFISFFIFSLMS